jgi:hypothetical protein
MLNKEVKIVRLNESRYMEDEFGIKTLMLYEDELVENLLNQNSIGEIIEYDEENNMYLVEFEYSEEVWLHRNEFLVLIKNLF